MHGFFSTKMKN